MPRLRSQNEPSDSQTTIDTLDVIMKKLEGMDKRLENLEDKISSMETGLNYHVKIIEDLQTDVSALKLDIPVIKKKVEEGELSVLNKCVEIQGVPHHTKESLTDIVVCIADKVSVNITKNNLDLAYRNKNKKSIIVRFVQTHYRNLFMKSFKKETMANRITSKDLGFQDKSTIFVNESLLYETRDLFFHA